MLLGIAAPRSFAAALSVSILILSNLTNMYFLVIVIAIVVAPARAVRTDRGRRVHIKDHPVL